MLYFKVLVYDVGMMSSPALLQERQRGASVIQALLQQRHVSQLRQRVRNQAAARGPQVRKGFIHF